MSRTVLMVLALLAAGGYWIADHWGQAKEAMGVEEPDELRAVQVAKNAFCLNRLLTNEVMIAEQLKELEDVSVKGWRAIHQAGPVFLVKYEYTERKVPAAYTFEVNLENQQVKDVETDEELARKYGVTPR